jgi:hypothetical protein
MSHRYCTFDWSWIERLHPDEVWWMPTERYMLFCHGTRPANMPIWRPATKMVGGESNAVAVR